MSPKAFIKTGMKYFDLPSHLYFTLLDGLKKTPRFIYSILLYILVDKNDE